LVTATSTRIQSEDVLTRSTCYRRNVNKDGTGMLSYDNDLSLPVLVPMKTSFPSAKALKLSLGWQFTCFQIKFITNTFFFTGRCHFQLSNIRITNRFWLAGDDDYLRGASSINHQVALRANFKMYSRSAKGGEKGDPNRNPWLAKMQVTKCR
jgi:hypothetical protein